MRQATDALGGSRSAGVDRSGTVIAGRFRLEVMLGREGGTEVYQAIDGTTGAAHAVRVIPFSVITGGPERLVAEIEKTQALRHKNLVEVEAVGVDGDVVYIAAELIDGQTLRDFIDAKRAEGRGVSVKGACNLVAHVANALDYASRVARHGALNPAIIWVNRAGRVKVSGLGIAGSVPGFARHGAPTGFPDTVYLAPEAGAGPAKAAADVYSLGVIFYELLTGTPPGTPFQQASRLAAEVPTAVDQVLARALSHTPEDRWPTPTAFKDALQQTGGPLPSATQTYGGSGRSPAAPVAVPVASVPAAPAPRQAPGGRPTSGAPAVGSPRAAAPGSGRNTATAVPTAAATAGAAAAAPRSLDPRPSQKPMDAASPPLPVGPEDNVEKWLIHKDSLDFGPFSMVQIRAQIERGEILADHLVIDNDTGTKVRVRDIAGLGVMAKHAGRRLEAARRAQAEQRSEKSEKKKSMFTGVVVTLVLLAVGAGVGIFLLTRHDTSGGHLASREEEAEIDNFLKGVKIDVSKAVVRRGASGGAHHAGSGNLNGGNAEDFNNDSNFGDVGKGLSEGDQTLDDDQIQNTMMANYRKLIPCIVHSPGVSNIALEFAVRGNGKVSAVKVNGQRTGALPACMLGRMQSFNFPKFNGSKTIASWSMSMGR